jgi:hypothetical protein
MTYTMKSHPTRYKNTLFRSRLEARWAAWADIVGWEWEYEPVDLEGWTPDFRFRFPCGHSECPTYHELYAEVKPYRSLSEFNGHQATQMDPYSIPSPALFGINPGVTQWEMVHGDGSGIYSVADWVEADPTDEMDCDRAWEEAGNRTRYTIK